MQKTSRKLTKLTKDAITVDGNCYNIAQEAGLHVGTSASFFTYETEWANGEIIETILLCMGGQVDQESYSPHRTICGGAIFSKSLKNKNMKMYVGGGGLWTETLYIHRIIPRRAVAAYIGLTQTNPGWSAKVRVDFCSGDTVIYSRTTWWGTKPEKPEEPEYTAPDICKTELIALGDGGALYAFNYQPVELETVDEPDCTVQVVCPWDDPETEVRSEIFALDETKTYSNPENENEIFTLTYSDFFRSTESTLITLTACYESGVTPGGETPDPNACPIPTIESITIEPENPLVDEIVKVTVKMTPGRGAFLNCGLSGGCIPRIWDCTPEIHYRRTNIQYIRFDTAGVHTFSAKIENTCHRVSPQFEKVVEVCPCVSMADVLDDYNSSGTISDADKDFVMDHWDDSAIHTCREQCSTEGWNAATTIACIKARLRKIASSLQTTELNATEDTHTAVYAPEDCLGEATQLPISENSSNAYIQFDTSHIPKSLTKATLKLYLHATGNNKPSTFDVRRVTTPWSESGDACPTWDVSPSSTITNQATGTAGAYGGYYVDVDVTAIVKDMLAYGNAGFFLTWSSGPYIWFSSRNSSEATERPRLIVEHPPLPPTISSISWSPTGDYATIAAGASLVESVVGGGTTQLMLVATNPTGIIDPPLSDGEAILQIDQEDPFIVASGDHFRFNEKEWWALNIICGPECDIITLADEVAQFEKIPKIGDEIQFAAAIDWHDQEMSTIKWYYAKSPGECFSDIFDLDWEEFAVGENTNMPAHTFEDEGDEEIAFFMVTATNMNFATGTLDTLCGPIFNLWKPAPPGFIEGWLVAAFMAFIIPALAEKTEYFADLVFDGDTDPDTDPDTPSGGFSLLWAPVTFVVWIAEAAAAVAEDMWDIIFGAPEEEDAGGYGMLWTAAEFVAWLYKSIAAMVEDILDHVFGED